MDLYGHEGGARPWLQRQYDRAKRFGRRLIGGASYEEHEGGAGIRTRAARADRLRDGTTPGFRGKAAPGGWWTPERQQHAIDRLKAGGVTELGARALVARWSAVEAGAGPSAVNPSSGAFGVAQWLGARKRGIAGNTNFDDQIDHALKELHGPEGKALSQLNRATNNSQAAIGASMFERAENYNPRTGMDDWTGKTATAMGRLVGADKVDTASASAKPAVPSGVAETRRDVLADPNDERRKVMEQKVAESVAAAQALKDAQRARSGGTLAERAAAGSEYGPQTPYPGSRSIKQMNDWLWDKKGPQPTDWKKDPSTGNWKPVLDGAKPNAALDAQRAGAQAAIAQVQAAQAASVSNTANDNRNSYHSENHIGSVNVITPATDASGIARDIKPALQRHAFATAANYARA